VSIAVLKNTLCIEDEFEGFDDGQVFLLSDGSTWIQDEYQYVYHYAYRPKVALTRSKDGRVYLSVQGMRNSVAVRPVTVTIRSRIAGEFKGWLGNSEYTLSNGQIWRQARYHYHYHYHWTPTVIIFQDAGRYHMVVAGLKAEVRRLK
jgi:hypothetical protein